MFEQQTLSLPARNGKTVFVSTGSGPSVPARPGGRSSPQPGPGPPFRPALGAGLRYDRVRALHPNGPVFT